ncbi:hypothetical protein PR202_gb25818 [Eleusine coracana subsp. coracana]|uniref:Uncharacterized protein n=1 Tax=Eleusine coracana subsp. coracana TaxID=191504 RepID=A0AAV5FQE2_ELECO|nr:hypothetical protein PR202_gb25782 [Eleusine coracana subsp. coracana]GJN36915.1 hypothetical protein PR202_gb25818 [Eleusine coracana subsp. coracana]
MGTPNLRDMEFEVELGWFQSTASGYYQLGIVVAVNENFYKSLHHHHEHVPESLANARGRKLQLFLQNSNEVKSGSALHKLWWFKEAVDRRSKWRDHK